MKNLDRKWLFSANSPEDIKIRYNEQETDKQKQVLQKLNLICNNRLSSRRNEFSNKYDVVINVTSKKLFIRSEEPDIAYKFSLRMATNTFEYYVPARSIDNLEVADYDWLADEVINYYLSRSNVYLLKSSLSK